MSEVSKCTTCRSVSFSRGTSHSCLSGLVRSSHVFFFCLSGGRAGAEIPNKVYCVSSPSFEQTRRTTHQASLLLFENRDWYDLISSWSRVQLASAWISSKQNGR